MAAPVLPSSTQPNGTTTETPTQITGTAQLPANKGPFKILVVPGDHVGPEVMAEALKVLEVLREERDVDFVYEHEIMGGASINARGKPVTQEVLDKATASDAVLFGSVGGPEWGHAQPNPESALLTLRAHLSAFANIRPCAIYSKSLLPLSPLKPHIVENVDFVVLRENCGGAYYGTKTEEADFASDVWQYSTSEIERCARVAASLARTMGRDGKGGGGPAVVTSSDKANVLANSRLWRRVVSRVFAEEFPDIELRHQLADSLSLMMMTAPSRFNGVILTDNTFGDMLSDQAGGVVGTLGVLPSASLCAVPGTGKKCNGIYEPVHGSAPDISGRGLVNPVAQILSAALMCRYSLGLEEEALLIERAVEKTLDGKDIGGLEIRTGDLRGSASTKEVGDAICGVLRKLLGEQDGVKQLGDGLKNVMPGRQAEVHADENKKYEDEVVEEAETGPQTALTQQ